MDKQKSQACMEDESVESTSSSTLSVWLETYSNSAFSLIINLRNSSAFFAISNYFDGAFVANDEV